MRVIAHCLAAFSLALFALAGCGGGGGGGGGAEELTVEQAQLIALEIAPLGLNLPQGSADQFFATGIFSDGSKRDLSVDQDLVWSVDAPSLATIDGTGLLTAQPGVQGRLVLTATRGPISGQAEVTVTPASLEQIVLNPTAPTLAPGTSQRFTATGIYSDSKIRDITGEVTWETSDRSVLAPEGTNAGLLAALKQGTATLSATLEGKTATTLVTVSGATLVQLEITTEAGEPISGTTSQATVTAVYSDGSRQDVTNQVQWSSSDPTILGVGTGGELVALEQQGQVQVAATLEGIATEVTLEVVAATLESLTITPADIPELAKGISYQLGAIGHYSNGTTRDLTREVLWRSDNLAVAGIINLPASAGLLHSFSAGQALITAALGEVEAQQPVTVTGATLTRLELYLGSLGVSVGTTTQFGLVGRYSDGSAVDLSSQAVWLSLDQGIATVGNAPGPRGLVTGVQTGEVFIVALVSKLALLVKMTVVEPIESLHIAPTAGLASKGAALTYTAQATYWDGTTQDVTNLVAWTTSDPLIAAPYTLDFEANEVQIRALKDGVAQISATLGGVTSLPAALEVVDLRIDGVEVTGGAQFSAIRSRADGQEEDLTNEVVWSVTPAGVLAISNEAGSQGFASISGPGECLVQALYAGQVLAERPVLVGAP